MIEFLMFILLAIFVGYLHYKIYKLENPEPPVLKYSLDDGVEELYEVFPHVGSAYSSGFDVKSTENVIIAPGQRYTVGTGIRFEIPEGYEIQARPRSGLAAKQGLTVLNTPGTIDEDYRGEVKIILHNTDRNEYMVSRGDRIAQLVLAKRTPLTIFEQVSEVNETIRGEGGFGSSGK